MPLYDFACAACGHEFEVLAAAGAAVSCPTCGAPAHRVYSPIAKRGPGVGLRGAAARESDSRRAEREAVKKERFVAERKRARGEGPPGG